MEMLDNKSMNGSWLEVEMNETVDLLRKKLEWMNNMEPCEVSSTELQCFKNLYKTLYYILTISKAMK